MKLDTDLGHSPHVSHNPQVTSGLREFTLSFDENVLAEFVKLPEDALSAQVKPGPAAAGAEAGSVGGLWYSQILCGVIRGALEMVIYRILLVMLIDIYWSLESHSGRYGRQSQICL